MFDTGYKNHRWFVLYNYMQAIGFAINIYALVDLKYDKSHSFYYGYFENIISWWIIRVLLLIILFAACFFNLNSLIYQTIFIFTNRTTYQMLTFFFYFFYFWKHTHTHTQITHIKKQSRTYFYHILATVIGVMWL